MFRLLHMHVERTTHKKSIQHAKFIIAGAYYVHLIVAPAETDCQPDSLSAISCTAEIGTA